MVEIVRNRAHLHELMLFRKVVGIGAIVALSFAAFASPSVAGAKAEDEADMVAVSTPTTPLLSARRFPGALQSVTADPELSASIEQYVSKVVGATCVRIEQDGRVIYSKDSSEAFAPASTMKLATALAALDVLGPETTFTTRFLSNKQPKNGVVEGDLYVVGGGDPLFATPGYKTVFDDPDNFYEDFVLVAEALKDAGIKEITGNIVGDDSRYDTVRWVPTWPTRYQVGGTVAPLSALVVNDGNTGYTETPNDPTTNRKAWRFAITFRADVTDPPQLSRNKSEWIRFDWPSTC